MRSEMGNGIGQGGREVHFSWIRRGGVFSIYSCSSLLRTYRSHLIKASSLPFSASIDPPMINRPSHMLCPLLHVFLGLKRKKTKENTSGSFNPKKLKGKDDGEDAGGKKGKKGKKGKR